VLKKENLTPTAEQEAILSATGHRVKINARAGAGKTAAMQMLAERLSSKNNRVLYLVFNKRAKLEVQTKMKGIATVDTVHGFANKSIPSNKPLYRQSRSDLNAADLLEAFEIAGASNKQTGACLTADFLSYFLNSEHEKLEHAVEPFITHVLAAHQSTVFREVKATAIRILTEQMQAWVNGEAPCPHDFYLKLAAHHGWFADKLAKYDVLLVDEAQDLSPVMIGLLSQFAGRVFIVGDEHQQIYEFRYAVDAMRLIEGNETLDLTTSFRFGPKIAPIVTSFIREAKGEPAFVVRGNKQVISTAEILGAGSKPIPPGGAILARTNLGLFETAIAQLDAGIRIAFTADIQPMIVQARNVHRLSQGDRQSIKDRMIASFSNLNELESHAKTIDDRKLHGLVKLVRNHGSRLPSLLSRLSKIPTQASGQDCVNCVLLTTIHGAKGLEFPEVRLCDDMFKKLAAALKDNTADAASEANVVYVAMTRAKNRLVLPACVSELPINWPDLARSHSSATAATSVTAKFGARVRTPLGSGYLVIDGSDKSTHLVKLDRQAIPARLMKRLVQFE